jgi:hypothetical protein
MKSLALSTWKHALDTSTSQAAKLDECATSTRAQGNDVKKQHGTRPCHATGKSRYHSHIFIYQRTLAGGWRRNLQGVLPAFVVLLVFAALTGPQKIDSQGFGSH